MTEFVDVPGGRIAYEVTGSGPLVVLSHGIGVRRQDYRFLGLFLRYLDLAYPARPADYPGYRAALAAKLREPGRMAEFLKTFNSPADAERQLPHIRCPALVIMGTADPDFAGPRAEGDAI